ncbi:MAG: tetratricopeptide repeat protein, partial [Gemmatimonadota bacterium]|nr:tetratricopeptide repeat protein [Gemmatimonadota bacterium]
PMVGRAYHNLGFLTEEEGNVERAAELYRRAWEIRLATLGETHPETEESAEATRRLDATEPPAP